MSLLAAFYPEEGVQDAELQCNWSLQGSVFGNTYFPENNLPLEKAIKLVIKGV